MPGPHQPGEAGQHNNNSRGIRGGGSTTAVLQSSGWGSALRYREQRSQGRSISARVQRVLVGAFLHREVGRNGFKGIVRVYKARYLNRGQVPSSFGVMARFSAYLLFFSAAQFYTLEWLFLPAPPLLAPHQWHAHPLLYCLKDMCKRAFPIKICNTPKTPKT